MKAVVALGNPGATYAKTRHNFGWAALDFYLQNHDLKLSPVTKFKAALAKDPHGNLLVKPLGFYNLSGEVVQKIAAFYKLRPEEILVIHDDMDLPVGTLRRKTGGSDAGNNGVRNLILHLGESFTRLRIGSGQTVAEERADYVLTEPSKEELKMVEALYPKIAEEIEEFLI
jgi:PTH1 family peptidyl-tRNA hydrolase